MRTPFTILAAAGFSAMLAGCGGATNAAVAPPGAGTVVPVPQITAMEAAADNDGPAATAKLPQGMAEAQARAAGMGTDGAVVITVTGTDTTCVPDRTTVPAGKVWLRIVNRGAKITELYLESGTAEELAEVEEITTGQAGGISVSLQAGSYLLACEPGMNDFQVRTPLTVTA